MSNYFPGIESTGSKGQRFAYDFLQSAAVLDDCIELLPDMPDAEIVDALSLVVRAGVALARRTAAAEGGRRVVDRAASSALCAASGEILNEVRLRDEEGNRQPPQAEVLVQQAIALHPELNDPAFVAKSGLDLYGQNAGLSELSGSFA